MNKREAPEVLGVAEVPGGRVADDLPVFGLIDDRMIPKRLGHRAQSQGREEFLGRPEHPLRSVILHNYNAPIKMPSNSSVDYKKK